MLDRRRHRAHEQRGGSRNRPDQQPGLRLRPPAPHSARRPTPSRRCDLAELRLGRGGVRQLAVAAQPARRVRGRRRQSVTVLASSGDGGTTNTMKQPVRTRADPVSRASSWPASDPLVTGVGGTYLCTDPGTGLGVDTPIHRRCQMYRQPRRREIGWIDSGGGFSTIFRATRATRTCCRPGAPAFPAEPNMRGVPDIAYQASATTGVSRLHHAAAGRRQRPDLRQRPCSTGWYAVGGTSASSPQWAGLVAIADQVAGRTWPINPALYKVANDPASTRATSST